MRDRGFRSVQGVLISVMLYFGAGFFFAWNAKPGFHVFMGMACALLLFWMSGFENRVYVVSFFAFLGILFGGVSFWGVQNDQINWVTDGTYSILEYGGFKGMNLLFEGLLVLTISAMGYLLAGFLQSLIRVKRVVAFLLIALSVASVYARVSIPRWALAAVCCYFIMTFAEWYECRWKKNRQSDTNAYMAFLTPFFVLYFLLITIAPYKETPYGWVAAKNLWLNMTAGIDNLLGSWFYGDGELNLPTSGFAEKTSFFGNVDKGNRVMLRIKIGIPVQGNLYLRGKTMDTFMGRDWMKQDQSTKQDAELDALELAYAVRRYDNEYYRDYIRDNGVQITYEKQKVQTLFLPGKTCYIYSPSRTLYPMLGGDVALTNKMGYGYEYKAVFYQMNLGSEPFEALLHEKALEENEEIWTQVVRQNKSDAALFSYEMLEQHRKNIHEIYGEKPILSEKIRDWAERVTVNCETGYDKLKALEKELAGLSYNSRPGEMPDEVKDASSYLEYFLLEKKEGFCTYFATAFTLLARDMGYPARYVHGYCVPGNETEVYSKYAHAWPEVYFEGIGWIPFEPTPGYNGKGLMPWSTAKRENESGAIVIPHNQDNPNPEYHEEPEEPEQAEAVSEEKNSAWKEQLQRLWQVALIIIVILSVSVLLLIIEVVHEYIRRKRRSLSQEYHELVAENFRILHDLGLPRFENETLTEYEDRLRTEEIDQKGYDFLEAYETIVYGSCEANRELVSRAKECRGILLDYLENEKGSLILLYKIKLYLYHKN